MEKNLNIDHLQNIKDFDWGDFGVVELDDGWYAESEEAYEWIDRFDTAVWLLKENELTVEDVLGTYDEYSDYILAAERAGLM